MKVVLLLISVLVALAVADDSADKPQQRKAEFVCYYDSASFIREGMGKLIVDDVEPALHFCTVLVYGYAGIERTTFKAVSRNPSLDLDFGKGLYRTVTSLKSRYPHLKIMLSVGGGNDRTTADKNLPNKYLQLLESADGRSRFISTIYSLVKTYNFDGLDLAWQFTRTQAQSSNGIISSLWNTVMWVLFGDYGVDEKARVHKEQFTSLMRDLKTKFSSDRFLLSATVLPNVNSSLFYDIPAIKNYVDYVNLATFDFFTPERNPYRADYSAPLYELPGRHPLENVNAQVQHWLKNGFRPSRLNVGVANYAQAWSVTSASSVTGVPPLDAASAAPAGPEIHSAGQMSWPELCVQLPNEKGAGGSLSKVADPSHRKGLYAFRQPTYKNSYGGRFVSYEDPETAMLKAEYVSSLNLGGIALFDLSYDDFRGTCAGGRFPFVRAIMYRLSN